jgi:hypothetical protein
MKHTKFIIPILFLCGCSEYKSYGNYHTAFLKKTGQEFTITIKGRRSLHPAGFFDIGKTYEDSFQYIIPVDSGIIHVEDLPQDSCCYPRFGTIEINGDKLEMNIYANDTDRKEIESFSWNGKYDLEWTNSDSRRKQHTPTQKR